MKINCKEQFEYVHSLKYPVVDGYVQKCIDDTNSIEFARFASKKALRLAIERISFLLSNELDNFDLDVELSNLLETLSFVKNNYHI